MQLSTESIPAVSAEVLQAGSMVTSYTHGPRMADVTTNLLLSEHVWLPTVAMLLLAVHVFMQWRRGTASLRKTTSAETKDPKDQEEREDAAADNFPQPPWWRGGFGLWPGSGYVVFESAKTPEQLKADLRATLGPVWDIITPGCKGWVLGPCARVGWLPRWYGLWERSHLAFRGWLVKGPKGKGCSLGGHIRMHFLMEAYLVCLYLGMLGTLAFNSGGPHPWRNLAVCAATLVGITWVTGIGAKAAVREIHRHLTQVCAALPPTTMEEVIDSTPPIPPSAEAGGE